MADIATLAIAETLSDTDRLIHYSCRRFLKAHPDAMEYEEAFSIACEAWVEAYHSHDSSRGEFSTHLCCRIRFALLNAIRAACKHHRAARSEIDPDEIARCQPKPFWTDFWESLTADAREVVELIFYTPSDLLNLMNRRGESPRDTRSSLRDYLMDKGWGHSRVMNAFNEIREAVR